MWHAQQHLSHHYSLLYYQLGVFNPFGTPGAASRLAHKIPRRNYPIGKKTTIRRWWDILVSYRFVSHETGRAIDPNGASAHIWRPITILLILIAACIGANVLEDCIFVAHVEDDVYCHRRSISGNFMQTLYSISDLTITHRYRICAYRL